MTSLIVIYKSEFEDEYKSNKEKTTLSSVVLGRA